MPLQRSRGGKKSHGTSQNLKLSELKQSLSKTKSSLIEARNLLKEERKLNR